MANEDWELIERIRASIGDMDRLRGDSLEVLNQNNQLMRMIDLMNRPLMGVPTDKEL